MQIKHTTVAQAYEKKYFLAGNAFTDNNNYCVRRECTWYTLEDIKQINIARLSNGHSEIPII